MDQGRNIVIALMVELFTYNGSYCGTPGIHSIFHPSLSLYVDYKMYLKKVELAFIEHNSVYVYFE
jgi:hypothetical protein